jgi:hypothetical protein
MSLPVSAQLLFVVVVTITFSFLIGRNGLLLIYIETKAIRKLSRRAVVEQMQAHLFLN